MSVRIYAAGASQAEDPAAKDKIAALDGEYKQLQAQQEQINSQIKAAKTEKEKKIALSQQIGAQIETTRQQIGLLEQRISLLDQNIAEKEKEQKQKQVEADAHYALFKQRLRALVTMPEGSGIGVLLGANSYSQMVTSTVVMERVSAYDRNIIEELTAEKEALQKLQREIEANKASLVSDKSEMDAKNAELGAQMSEAKSQIQDISAQEAEFMANKDAMMKQMKQVQAEINAIYAELAKKTNNNIPYVGGVMGWPTVSSLTQVSSGYGVRFGGNDDHKGIDITGMGAYGQPVLAANDGTVVVVHPTYEQGTGYGKYVIVDHGGGYTTLYAHCSSLVVSEGERVAKGQKIAEIGQTGWATGPHVHFEVRVNGTAANPVPFLQG